MLTHNFWETTTPVIAVEKAVGYLPIPALTQLADTSGVPFACAQYIYQCPNNFCIPSIPLRSSVINLGSLAIRYNVPNSGSVVRYKFWDIADDAIEDIPAPLYTGQPILGANFAIEVWTLGVSAAVIMPFGILLATSVQQALVGLTDPSTFQLGTVTQCPTVESLNGLNVPLQYSQCAAAQYTAPQTGTVVSITPGVQIPNIPVVGANYRFNQTTGELEILNITTGLYNPLNTQGQSGQESIIIDPQE